MTLIGAILKKAKSQESITRKYTSPPPEIEGELQKKKRRYVFDKYSHIRSVVDASPPEYLPGLMTRTIPKYHRHLEQIYYQNIQLLMAIKKAHFMRGRVDCWWKKPPPDYSQQYYKNRMNSFKRIQIENQIIYKRIVSTEPRVASTASLQDDWRYNRRQILLRAQAPFILFQPVPKEIIEDAAFETPMGIKRPRVYLTLRIKNCGILGELTAELFTDVCPLTCDLFLTLLDGDEAGHAYVGTKFFRMLVPESGYCPGKELFIKIISTEGQMFSARFAEDTLIEEIKNRALDYFYPNGENGSSRYKIVRVLDTTTLDEYLTLAQEQVLSQEEFLLVERRIPEAGTLWDLGTVRAPQLGTIAAATASLPPPQTTIPQPNLQSLLSTNELSYELKKVLMSLIEAGANLAAAGRNYELTLSQLSAALDEPQNAQTVIQATPEEIASKLNSIEETSSEAESSAAKSKEQDLYRRAEHLQRFLEKFRAWKIRIAAPPNGEAMTALKDLGFSSDEADEALRFTGCNVPAAASWLLGERGSSIFELVYGLPNGSILQSLLKQPQIQRGLLNTRMLIAFIAMVGQTGSASLWLKSPHGSPLLSQISRTYHSEKYCLAVNQFSETKREQSSSLPSTSRQRN